jgi:hypothetical protein
VVIARRAVRPLVHLGVEQVFCQVRQHVLGLGKFNELPFAGALPVMQRRQ